MSGAALLGPYGLLLGAVLQGAEPPPTSGNGMTIFLGLTASSLIVVVVAGATLRGLRRLRSSNSRSRPGPLGMRTDPIPDDPESSGDQ